MKRILWIGLLVCFFFYGCSSTRGTHLVTGRPRAETYWPDVAFYHSKNLPPHEVIGLVAASSSDGWTTQDDLELAMCELQKQAALMGANGIVVESMSEISYGSTGYITGDGFFFSEENVGQRISGTAIFVSDYYPDCNAHEYYIPGCEDY